jgi:protein ImuB
VDRLACIDLHAFPLQLLLQARPDWADLPAAVVAEDKPQAALLWVNERARRSGILPGQRYAAALSLALDLRAAPVAPSAIARGVDALADRLRRHTPGVEPAADEPGVFWLSASGFDRLYGSAAGWAAAVQEEVGRAGFTAHLAVGFTRFGTYAVAKAGGRQVLASPEEERRMARGVPLDRLGLDPALREALDPLGVKTVGDFLRLPPGGLLARFGPQAHRLHRLAAGDLWAPLRPVHPEEPRERRIEVDPPDAEADRLLFLGKRLLDSLLPALHARGEAVQALALHLLPERGAARVERVSPAAPTLDGLQLARLLRLKLESLRLDTPVAEVALVAEVVPATAEQLRLTAPEPRRDPAVRARALARLRAALGEDAVAQARLRDAHMPEMRFEWIRATDQRSAASGQQSAECRVPSAEPEQRRTEGGLGSRGAAPSPCSSPGPRLSLVRRIYREPLPLSAPPRHGSRRVIGNPQSATHCTGGKGCPGNPQSSSGWLPLGAEVGPVTGLRGPSRFSGGWWEQDEQRDYYFLTLAAGDVLWVFRDPRRHRWFLQGRVE